MMHHHLDKPTINDSPSACRREAGFTLLEIIVSIVLLGLLTAIFGMGLVAAVRSHEFSRTNVDLTQKSQLAMTRIQRELLELTRVAEVTDDQTTPGINRFIIYERMVAGNNLSTVRFGLHHNPGDHSLYLYTDLNSAVTQLDGSTIGQADVLIDRVENIRFECFKGADAWDEKTDDQSLLSTIQVTLDLERRDAPETNQRFRTVVHMRNNDNAGGIPPDTPPLTQNDYSCFIGGVARIFPWCRPEADDSDRKGMR
ncbi:MAG: prepilin-type N-terminal cleavage/methylation domain-containing protein [Desulfobacteraceae bacterium]|jgi:prepilin-type N-terminal cleavage/methylation domain-containing protein